MNMELAAIRTLFHVCVEDSVRINVAPPTAVLLVAHTPEPPLLWDEMAVLMTIEWLAIEIRCTFARAIGGTADFPCSIQACVYFR